DGLAGSNDLPDRMMRADDFRVGEQWDPAVRQSMENKGKFALTIPLIKPKIKHVAGTQIKNPRQITVKPTRSGTDSVAKLLTACAKQVFDAEKLQFEKSQCFEAGMAIGQGVMVATKDRTEDPKHANIKIERVIEHEVLFDPTCIIYDINHRNQGCKYVIWEPWVDKDLVRAEYPAKKAELDAMGHSTGGESIVMGVVNTVIDWMTGRRRQHDNAFSMNNRADTDVLTRTRFKMSHTFWREPKECVWWFDARRSEMDALLLTESKQISAAKASATAQPEVFSVETVICNVMHHTIRVGDIFLEDRVNEWNTLMYPVFVFWPYLENGNKGSLTEDLIGTQQEINWLHSQSLNMVKLLANTGYKIKSDPTGEMAAWLEVHGGEDGIVLDLSKFGGDVEKIEPNDLPAPTIVLEQGAQENLNKISGIRTEDPTTDKDRVASAIALKQQASLTGSATVFRNWDWTMSIQADFIIEVIRHNDIFSEDEIREIVDREDLIDKEFMEFARQIVISQFEQQGITIEPPADIDEVALQSASPEAQEIMIKQAREDLRIFNEIQQIVNNEARPMAEAMLLDSIHSMRKGKYSTKVTLSPLSETMRMIKSAELFELHKILIEGGDVGLDGETLIDGTDIDNKEEVKAARNRKLQSLQQSNANVSLSRTA
ncbi:hypothetical protein LCGC14_1017900, partial [marine sediment metagenome]